MRVLFVTPYLPSRIRVRSYGFVSHLTRRHEVTVLAGGTSERDYADAEALRDMGIRVILVRDRRSQQLMRSLRALGTTEPLQVAFGATPALRTVLEAELASDAYDVLHMEHLRSVGALPHRCPIPVVWDAVDCVSHLFEQGAGNGTSLLLRAFGRIEAQRTRRFEAQQLRRFREVLVSCPREREMLLRTVREQPGRGGPHHIAEVTVVPNGVDQTYFRQCTGLRRSQTLVFSGKMSYHANVAGALTLARSILPLIWAQRPQVRVIIAGSNPPPQVRMLAHDPRIEVTGYVPDLRPYIAQAQVAVSPLPYAVGMQNKVLEAMALGTPVVASPTAASGLQAAEGRDLLVASSPEAFAAAVLRLLDDPALWQAQAAHGLSYVGTHHNWEQVVARLVAVYRRAQRAQRLRQSQRVPRAIPTESLAAERAGAVGGLGGTEACRQ